MRYHFGVTNYYLSFQEIMLFIMPQISLSCCTHCHKYTASDGVG